MPLPARVGVYQVQRFTPIISPMNHFQNNLKRIRKEAGLRQIDVAEKLGHTSADRISHWEKGLAAPGLVNLFKLSTIYGASPEQLYSELYTAITSNTFRDVRDCDRNRINANDSGKKQLPQE